MKATMALPRVFVFNDYCHCVLSHDSYPDAHPPNRAENLIHLGTCTLTTLKLLVQLCIVSYPHIVTGVVETPALISRTLLPS